jgi:hypothetical protein
VARASRQNKRLADFEINYIFITFSSLNTTQMVNRPIFTRETRWKFDLKSFPIWISFAALTVSALSYRQSCNTDKNQGERWARENYGSIELVNISIPYRKLSSDSISKIDWGYSALIFSSFNSYGKMEEFGNVCGELIWYRKKTGDFAVSNALTVADTRKISSKENHEPEDSATIIKGYRFSLAFKNPGKTFIRVMSSTIKAWPNVDTKLPLGDSTIRNEFLLPPSESYIIPAYGFIDLNMGETKYRFEISVDYKTVDDKPHRKIIQVDYELLSSRMAMIKNDIVELED